MKKLIKLTLVVALVLGSSSLFAQKLGRINLEEIKMCIRDRFRTAYPS